MHISKTTSGDTHELVVSGRVDGEGVRRPRRVNRRKPAQPPPSLPMAASVAERLKHLEQLKQQSLISDTEYEEQRSRIITGV